MSAESQAEPPWVADWFDQARYAPAAFMPLGQWAHELKRRAAIWDAGESAPAACVAAWQSIWACPIDGQADEARAPSNPYATVREGPASGLGGGSGTTPTIEIDLKASHEQIEAEFAHWLDAAQTRAGIRELARLITSRDLATWYLTRLLAYIDVAAWFRVQGGPVRNADIAGVIFGSRTYARTVERAAQLWEIARKDVFLEAMRLQAEAERTGQRLVPRANPPGD